MTTPNETPKLNKTGTREEEQSIADAEIKPSEPRPPEGSPYWYEPGNATNGVCEDYEVLHGPDGFMCFLSEPEDRWFTRDAKPVVAKLNEQHTELAALRARCEKFETALREIVAGKMPCDLAAGEKNAGDLCAGRLCEIARQALEKP